MTDPPRVRFAPSPTGYLHVGGARTALFNWLFARQTRGTFVLRIEDTDQQRSSAAMTDAILEGLRWLGLEWDEGAFHQADGFERHRTDALRLLDSGQAYRCFCTAEELQARREAAEQRGDEDAFRYDRCCLGLPRDEATRRAGEGHPFTIRFRVPDGTTEWDDVVHGLTQFRNNDIEDFIILRSDGTPTYNLAVVSDDREMRITHVLRGDDHLSNTPKQILLYRALDAPVPTFGHLPMILGSDGKRLSKRHGATAISEYADAGFLPEALVNFLGLLGWNPGDEQEIMSRPELIARFSLERINKKSAVFDTAKLEWMNAQHLMRLSGAELLPLIAPRLSAAGLAAPTEFQDRHDWFVELLELLRPRVRFLDDFVGQARPFLAPTLEYEPAAVAKHWKMPDEVSSRLTAVRAALEHLEPWEPTAIEMTLREVADRLDVGFGKIVHPLRLALTGTAASPGIDAVVGLLGRELTCRRIDAALEALGAPTDVQTKG